jgi:hypothetical protein
MNRTLSNIEKMVLGFSALFVVAFMSFFFAFQGKNAKLTSSESQNINYEMAKAKSAESLYSLEGRDIDRENQELEAEVAQVKKGLVKNKTEAAKKADAVKATAAKSKTAPAAAAKKTEPSSKTAQNKIHDTQSHKTDSVATETLSTTPYSISPQVAFPEETDVTADPVAKKNFKSIAEWTKEIFASSDRQIILKFVAAYRSKEVSDSDFYSLVTQLLNSQDDSKKGFGLYALRAAPSYASYTTLVKSQSNMNTTYQAYIQETLLSYHQSGSLNYLRQALASNDKQIVLKTLEIIKVGYLDIENGTSSSLVDSRYRRGGDYATFSLQNYLAFLPQLTSLQARSQQSGDQDVYAAATLLVQTIQPSTEVAAN